MDQCRTCHGRGGKYFDIVYQCTPCGGRMGVNMNCVQCRGYGMFHKDVWGKCLPCNGTGYVTRR